LIAGCCSGLGSISEILIEGDDILGDGVNIAARLEGIADPVGICVSSSAYDKVRGKVAVEFTDPGEQRPKNIDRPVQVYAAKSRGHLGIATPSVSPTHSEAAKPLALPDKTVHRGASIPEHERRPIIAAHDGKVQMIDSSVVRVHQQAAAAEDACIGRSRGGLTTKLHLRVIGNGLSVQIELSSVQMNDAPMAEILVNELPAGAEVLADADWIRDLIEYQDTTPHIPPRSNRYDGITYSKIKYEKRNLIEHCFNKLKRFRHVATRYDRSALNYLAMVKIACVRLWLRVYQSAA
jgi:transposase